MVSICAVEHVENTHMYTDLSSADKDETHACVHIHTHTHTHIYIYLVKVASLAVECSMPYKQNVV